MEGERKTVAALFADLKGSTELMEDLDPEEARAFIDVHPQPKIDRAWNSELANFCFGAAKDAEASSFANGL